jgi:hypothetical protein
MTSIKGFPTSIETDFSSTSICMGKKLEENWIIDTPRETFILTLSAGAILSISLLSFSFLSSLVFVTTLIYQIPFVSTKFALFISLLSGALGIEVLLAKKIKCRT